MLADSQRNQDHFLLGYFLQFIGLLVSPLGHAHPPLNNYLLEL